MNSTNLPDITQSGNFYLFIQNVGEEYIGGEYMYISPYSAYPYEIIYYTAKPKANATEKEREEFERNNKKVIKFYLDN